MRAWTAQTKAEMLRMIRNRRFIIFSIAMPIAFYFLFVALIGADRIVDGASWNAYYLMSMGTFGLVGASLNSLGIRMAYERTQGWVRLLQTTPLPAGIYLSTKIVSQFLMNALILAVMFAAGGLVEHVHLSAAQWVESGLGICFGMLPFIAFGILIGMSTGSETAQVIATGSQLTLAMLGGLWMPISQLPKTLQSIAKWMPTYHLGNIPWQIVGNHGMDWTDWGVLFAYLVIFVILSLWITRRQEAVRA